MTREDTRMKGVPTKTEDHLNLLLHRRDELLVWIIRIPEEELYFYF